MMKMNASVKFHINMKRWINTLLGDVMRPLITEDFASRLKKDDLDDGNKTCQRFCEKFIRQYNDQEKYNGSVFSISGYDQDASTFTKIPAKSWTLVKQKIKDLSAEYEKGHVQSKESGYHGNFEDLESVKSCPHLIYFHQMLEESGKGDILRDALLAQLPDGVFNESADPRSKKKKRGRGTGRGGGGGSGDDRGGNSRGRGGENVAFASIANKNNALQLKTMMETQSHLTDRLDAAKKGRRDAMKKLADHCPGGKKEAKSRFDQFQERKKQRLEKPNQEADSDSSDEDDDPQESQTSTCNEIFRFKKREKDMKVNIKEVNANMAPTRKN